MPEVRYQRTLVTAALPYANGPIHIGHLAGAYLPADLFCRYQRLVGRDIIFICGSDELGVAIMVRARKEGVDPKELVDRYHPQIRESFERFGISFDYYGRTTSDIHRETSQAFFRRLAQKDVFVLQPEEQLYDNQAGLFLADRFVIGTCPNCGFDEAHGDQCENCGTALSPKELLDPRSTLSDSVPELRSTTHWYLPLGRFQNQLTQWLDTRGHWKPNVLGQVRSWLKEGLRDRAITRDVPWGVPVPDDVADAAGVDASGKVIYVWFDAPIGYISATREWAIREGEPDRWKHYWQSSGSRLVHFIGKDNIVFHCIMFPAMLMAHDGYVLPENVPANEFLNIEGRKLSTSRGWAVWLHEYLEEFPPDMLRYALAATLPETKDADFSWKEFQSRVNNELADVLGNFINRTMTFAQRYFDGVVPALYEPNELDRNALKELAQYPARIGAAYETFRNREAVFETMALARLGNKYFNDSEPWKAVKSDSRLAGNTIHVSLQLCASLAILMDPVLPNSSQQLRSMLNLGNIRSSVPESSRPEGQFGWNDAGRPLLSAGHVLAEPRILFEKIEDESVEAQMAKLASSDVAPVSTEGEGLMEQKATISYDDFAKLDMRIGTIEEAEPVPKADRLLRLVVNIGYARRQIVAGVAEHFDPANLVGRRVVVVANLQPRRLRGLESEGMLLTAEDGSGGLFLVESEAEDGSWVS